MSRRRVRAHMVMGMAVAVMALIATAISPPAWAAGGLVALPGVTDAVQQPSEGCKDGMRFRFAVVRIDPRTQIVGYESSPGTVWAVVIVDVTNLGTRADNAQPVANVVDDRGRETEWTVFLDGDQHIDDEVAAGYSVAPSYQFIQPGRTVRTALTFLVADDARSLILKPISVNCEGETSAPATTGMPTTSAPPATSITTSSPPSTTTAPTETSSTTTTVSQQPVEWCKNGVRFRVAAASVDIRGVISDHPAAPGTVWAVVLADITNLGNRAENAQSVANIRDDRGREVEWTLFFDADQYVDNDVAAAYGVAPSWQVIQPGQTVRIPLTFLVAGDARGLTLVPISVNCES